MIVYLSSYATAEEIERWVREGYKVVFVLEEEWTCEA